MSGIAPDGFDLDEMLRAPSSTKKPRPKCPECGSIRVSKKNEGTRGIRGKPGKWRCANHPCRANFDKPEWGEQ